MATDHASRAISCVARGRPNCLTRFRMAAKDSGSASHPHTICEISSGWSEYAPNSLFTTNRTLPSSCPGKNDDKIIGSPQISASAIVPGPALVIMISLARIHSCMLSTKSMINTLTPNRRTRSASASTLFFPHIITTWTRGFILDAAKASATAPATSPNPPTPSPPPTSRTVLRLVLIFRLVRISDMERDSCQNGALTGRPNSLTWSSFKPCSRAISRMGSLGM
mmetsp:Transcript_4132/g.7543  ORF Transcript_4132/g.7543 Transcript_4132/m.7543 type:complete len:224 (-) Transcript_4132:174-845(-)